MASAFEAAGPCDSDVLVVSPLAAVRPRHVADRAARARQRGGSPKVDALLGGYLTAGAADAAYVPKTELGSRGGMLRWGYVRDLGATVEVYVDDESYAVPTMSVVRTATGVYEVTVPGIKADGGYHGILVSPQQGQTTVFRACKVFQTVSAGDPADTVIVRVRCYDAAGTLSAPASTSSCSSRPAAAPPSSVPMRHVARVSHFCSGTSRTRSRNGEQALTRVSYTTCVRIRQVRGLP